MISKISNVRIKGISCAIPSNITTVEELNQGRYSENELNDLISATGTNTLYHAKENQTSSDLCYEASIKLLVDIGWEKDEIDALIFISQTPDYILPATSFVLHNRLNLSKNCLVLDINLGCSAYIYGLFLAGQLLSSGSCKKLLLLVGDTLSKAISREDYSVSLIFSDGGSATALEYANDSPQMTFVINSNGLGTDHLIIPAGGFRQPKDHLTAIPSTDQYGNSRTKENLFMNGMEIFMFSIREIPTLINNVVKEHGWISTDVDKYLFHQASLIIMHNIAKKAKLPLDKIPINIGTYGNTSGVSIPLLICDKYSENELSFPLNIVMAGFGVGLSWGALSMTMDNILCSDILFV